MTEKRMAENKARVTSKSIVTISGILALLYAVGVPIFDLRYKVVTMVGNNFLDAHGNTTTFQTYMYYIAYLPLLVFSVIFAYGLLQRHIKKSKVIAIIIGLAIVIGCLFLYFALDFYFGFQYHFVF